MIEKYRNVIYELNNLINDLINMVKLSSLEKNRNNMCRLIEYYKDNEEIRKCILCILERCYLVRNIDTSVEPLLWNYEKMFLASYFYGIKILKRKFWFLVKLIIWKTKQKSGSKNFEDDKFQNLY